MRKNISPGSRYGVVTAPPSKSQMQRLLISAALGNTASAVSCVSPCADVLAAANCLEALGADIRYANDCFYVNQIDRKKEVSRFLPCGESGAVLRFLLPIGGAMGKTCAYALEGSLSFRPIYDYVNLLNEHGMKIYREKSRLFASGQLMPGTYILPGNVSSQYISGLLMALPLLNGDSTVHITGSLGSKNYINMTINSLHTADIHIERTGDGFSIHGGQTYCPQKYTVPEGDWSGASFFLCMGALSPGGVTVRRLSAHTAQGDSRVAEILADFGACVCVSEGAVSVKTSVLHGTEIDGDDIPDLIPPLCVVASAAEGKTLIRNIRRLRFKESDRLAGIISLLRSLGGDVGETEDGLVICGGKSLVGGACDPLGDHRMAMTAAVAACICENPVVVAGGECVQKSYPRFWDDFDSLEVQI